MLIAYYVHRIQNFKRYRLAGPYHTRDQAQRVINSLPSFNISDISCCFVNSTNHDYGSGFIMVSKFANKYELPSSFFGVFNHDFNEKNLFK